MQRTIFSTLIFLTLIVASLVILVKLQTKEYNKKITISETQEYMHKIHINNYDEQGTIKNSMTAESWQFFPEHQYSIIKHPNVIVYKPTGYVYNISADLGHLMHKSRSLSDKIDLIKLSHNVGIKQKHITKENPGFSLSTSYLEFNPTTELATTTKEVSISRTGLLITGIGMNADLKHNQLELHKNVTTKYQK